MPLLTRRNFVHASLAVLLAPTRALSAQREMDFHIVTDGFEASAADITAVVRSAATMIWQHCATTKLEFDFRIYRNAQHPITHFEREDGRIKIGLATRSTFWSQYAFQFAHEFCHALMDHANDWRRLWHAPHHANHWVEETICETGSLFALRSMGRAWQTKPPYAHWSSYAHHLTEYADERINNSEHRVPDGKKFSEWLASVLPEQRVKWTRARNTTIARELLPLFEAQPGAWDAIASINLCTRDPQMPLAKFLDEWRNNAGQAHREFIDRVRATFGVA